MDQFASRETRDKTGDGRGGKSGHGPSDAGPRQHEPASDQPEPQPEQRRAKDFLPAVTLPKGGGAIRGTGEKFSVAAATGTCMLSIPLALSAERGNFTPPLGLGYDSGAGNGPLGFGWSLSLPAITRKTDKGLPRYCDGDESDVYILAGAEDLVPTLDAAGKRIHLRRTVHGVTYQVSWYRPRIEGLFARIERWVAGDTGIIHWRSIAHDNVTTIYGFDPLASVADPADATKIFSWRISRSWDDKGNLAVYTYVAEDGAGVDHTQAHEVNRTDAIRGAQSYLKTVSYGNLTPYFPDWGAGGSATAIPADWMFKVVLDYGDHRASAPTPIHDQPWPLRPDPFSSYRAGFEVRTYRRVRRILFFNNFPAEAGVGTDCLVRSLDLLYSDQQAAANPLNPIYTFLISATQTGYTRSATGYVSRSLPPLEFDYSQPRIQSAVRGLDRDSLGNLPEGIDGTRFRWVDLDGEGLAGILTDAGGAWNYKHNLGANNLVAQADGSVAACPRFGPMEALTPLPSNSDLSGGQQFLDLNGDGRLELVNFGSSQAGFFKRTEDAGWEPYHQFLALPAIDWTEPNLKFIDLTGDGLADALITEDGLFTYHPSLGDAGFDAAQLVRTPWDEEKGPKVVLADGTETIFLADMSGDGLNDIVRVRNGEACYWPNSGYGRFGAKVTMDRAPRFADEERFDPRRIRLADIDGTGSADLLYVGDDGVRAWFNQSGNAWSAANQIGVFPSADGLSTVQVIDLLGTGTACLVWSSPLPAASAAPILYVDLMGGQKPHLLVGLRNNLGTETRVTYAPSTRFYLADQSAGKPWATHLPFPVQVIERVEIIDWIGRNRTVSRYAYHHGYFDGYEREFRGFGMVEQWDTEEYRADTAFTGGEFFNWDTASWSPPMLTRTWFHTGAFQEAGTVARQYLSEYWIEPALRTPPHAADAAAMMLPDTVLPTNLNAYEIQEAYRALKGRALRIETYAEDGSPAAANPYTVVEQNFTILCLQHMGVNPHSVFAVNPRETVSFHYERNAADPRVTHDLTLEVDNYGNVLRSVAVGYPRRPGYAPPEPALTASAQSMLAYDQARLHAVATEHAYTNPIDDYATLPDSYRTPALAATNVAELTGIAPVSTRIGVTNLFAFAEMDSIWQSLWTGAHDAAYEAVPAADLDGTGAPAATPTRRFIEQSRQVYRSDDLTALLAPGQLQPRGMPGQSYRAALTPGLLSNIFGALVTNSTLTEGGYVQLAGETGWWMPSGRLYYSAGDADSPATELAAARGAFFVGRRAVDPFGAVSRVDYDGYALLPTATTDPVGNVTSAANDYRVLMPATVTDPNGNRIAAAFDALGMVVGTAGSGKTTEALGDSLAGFVADLDDATIAAHLGNPLLDPGALLGSASARFVYDQSAYLRTRGSPQPTPPTAYTLLRETNVSDLAAGESTLYQHHFSYSDGFAREIQNKTQAAAGPLVAGGPSVAPRWIGSGWTIFNNKGNPVRQYEPFFSATGAFEFAAQNGVSTILFYDPAARVVATLHPDNTWEKIVFDCWRQESWDANDTVLIADPRTDAEAGNYFTRLLGGAPIAFTSWHDRRIGGTYGATADDQAAQQDAALKAAAHAATPAVAHFDALGRACLAIADNGVDGRYAIRTALDCEGKPLAVFDPAGQRVIEYVLRPAAGGSLKYVAGTDLAGNRLYQNGADGGARRHLGNVAGSPIRSWDARGHAFRMLYDAAQRSTHHYVSIGGAPEILIERSVYGEGLAAANLCGRRWRLYDTAGVTIANQHDYKGNLLSSTRQLAAGYRHAIDWTPLAGLTDGAALDDAAAGLLAPADRFDSSTVFDALNRPSQSIAPHSAAMLPSVIRPGYDEGNHLRRIDAWIRRAAAPTALLDPATADRHAVTNVDYNARGQRLAIAMGNGTATNYAYDPVTFRLTEITTTRPGSFAANQRVVQDLAYYYDPAGNITRVRDSADTQDVIYFNNQRVDPTADYTYDAIYRLIAARGREHLGQTGGALSAPQQITNDDSPRAGLPQPGDGNAMAQYTENYGYDALGNLLTFVHHVSSGAWTRNYRYAEPSQIAAAETCNRLTATSLPGDPASGPFSATYSYDAHGNMVRMPHLPAMVWDEMDRLRSTTRQVVTSGTPATTFYVYESAGQRARKTNDRQAAATQVPVRKSERIYLGEIEIYREFAADGATVTLERETLHLEAGGRMAALVETRTVGNDPALAQLTRYQHSNHLGSALLELDDASNIITYEEYFPFGGSSYQAVRNQIDTPKRYRYTNKERDEENDFYFHGARYYAPWLGRWTACDPAGLSDGINLYAFCRNNPIKLLDPDGKAGREATAHEKEELAQRGITDPDIVRRLVNLKPVRPKPGTGHGGGGPHHPAPKSGGGRDAGTKGGVGNQPGSPGEPGGNADRSQPGTPEGSPNGRTVNGSGVRQEGAKRTEGVGGVGKGPADPNAKPLTELDYAVLLASLLDPIHSPEKGKENVSGGMPGGKGTYASPALQGLYIAVNLIFTFAHEAVDSALRKAGAAIKAGLSKVWAKIGSAVVDAAMAPAFMAMGAGGLGGGGRIPKGALSGARRAARAGALAEALESLRAGNPTPQAAHLATRLEEVYGREALAEFMETGKLPKGVEFSHLFSASEYPEFAHRGDLGVLTDSVEHRAGHHGGDTRVPLHGFPRGYLDE